MITNYTGISGSRTAYLISSLTGGKPDGGKGARDNDNTVLIVVSSGRTAERLERDLSFCAPDAEIIVMQEEDDIQVLYEARSRESQVLRIKALQALVSGGSNQNGTSKAGHSGPSGSTSDGFAGTYIIAPVSAVVRLTESPERFIDGAVNVAVGDVYEPADLRQLLVKSGYTAAAVTESPGEFTARGGILDVFPPAMEHPVRIEFFGDEIDAIRTYDPDTQRSLENASEVLIGPAAEFIPSEDERRAALENIRKEYDTSK